MKLHGVKWLPYNQRKDKRFSKNDKKQHLCYKMTACGHKIMRVEYIHISKLTL